MEHAKRTSLYECHIAAGARFTPFAGWEMPIQYSGIVAEHTGVRNHVGLFDVSHMGEVFVEGPRAERLLQSLTCNDLSKITDGRAQYSALTNAEGGVVDDIIIYRFNAERFLVCVNASNAERDFQWIAEHNSVDAVVRDESQQWAQIAVQGPSGVDLLSRALGQDYSAVRSFAFIQGEIAAVPVIVARTGYTGEDGGEIFMPWERAPEVWDRLLQQGSSLGVIPAGLGARDSLRLEACLPLHGHELGPEITAIESGLAWIVKDKDIDYFGKSILLDQKNNGAPRALVGFYVLDAGIARHGDRVLDTSGAQVGMVTSGTKTPTVSKALGLGIVHQSFSNIGTRIQIEVRGRVLNAEVVPRPFYKRPKQED